MEEKILEILKDNKEWNSSLEYTAKELLNLFSVSDLVKEAYQQGFNDGASAAADSIAANPERL